MVKIYTSPSCSSCRKVKNWFKDQEIPFQEINILAGTIDKDELQEILTKSLDGTDEIISKRSKIMKQSKVSIDDMNLDDLLNFISQNPTVLKRPIIVDEKIIQVGYNEDEIRVFIPKDKRTSNWGDSLSLAPSRPHRAPNKKGAGRPGRKKLSTK